MIGSHRQTGQSAPTEMQDKDLRAELESNERQHFAKKAGVSFDGKGERRSLGAI
jgi:hypothetical protein